MRPKQTVVLQPSLYEELCGLGIDAPVMLQICWQDLCKLPVIRRDPKVRTSLVQIFSSLHAVGVLVEYVAPLHFLLCSSRANENSARANAIQLLDQLITQLLAHMPVDFQYVMQSLVGNFDKRPLQVCAEMEVILKIIQVVVKAKTLPLSTTAPDEFTGDVFWQQEAALAKNIMLAPNDGSYALQKLMPRYLQQWRYFSFEAKQFLVTGGKITEEILQFFLEMGLLDYEKCSTFAEHYVILYKLLFQSYRTFNFMGSQNFRSLHFMKLAREKFVSQPDFQPSSLTPFLRLLVVRCLMIDVDFCQQLENLIATSVAFPADEIQYLHATYGSGQRKTLLIANFTVFQIPPTLGASLRAPYELLTDDVVDAMWNSLDDYYRLNSILSVLHQTLLLNEETFSLLILRLYEFKQTELKDWDPTSASVEIDRLIIEMRDVIKMAHESQQLTEENLAIIFEPRFKFRKFIQALAMIPLEQRPLDVQHKILQEIFQFYAKNPPAQLINQVENFLLTVCRNATEESSLIRSLNPVTIRAAECLFSGESFSELEIARFTPFICTLFLETMDYPGLDRGLVRVKPYLLRWMQDHYAVDDGFIKIVSVIKCIKPDFFSLNFFDFAFDGTVDGYLSMLNSLEDVFKEIGRETKLLAWVRVTRTAVDQLSEQQQEQKKFSQFFQENLRHARVIVDAIRHSIVELNWGENAERLSDLTEMRLFIQDELNAGRTTNLSNRLKAYLHLVNWRQAGKIEVDVHAALVRGLKNSDAPQADALTEELFRLIVRDALLVSELAPADVDAWRTRIFSYMRGPINTSHRSFSSDEESHAADDEGQSLAPSTPAAIPEEQQGFALQVILCLESECQHGPHWSWRRVEPIFGMVMSTIHPQEYLELTRAMMAVYLDKLPSMLQELKEKNFSAEELTHLAVIFKSFPNSYSPHTYFEAILQHRSHLREIRFLFENLRSVWPARMDKFPDLFEILLKQAQTRLMLIFYPMVEKGLLTLVFYQFFSDYIRLFSDGVFQEAIQLPVFLIHPNAIKGLIAQIKLVWPTRRSLADEDKAILAQKKSQLINVLQPLATKILQRRSQEQVQAQQMENKDSIHNRMVHENTSLMAKMLIRDFWQTTFAEPFTPRAISRRSQQLEGEWVDFVVDLNKFMGEMLSIPTHLRTSFQEELIAHWRAIRHHFEPRPASIPGCKQYIVFSELLNTLESESKLTLKEFIVLLSQLRKLIHQARRKEKGRDVAVSEADVMTAFVEAFYRIFEAASEPGQVVFPKAICVGGTFNNFFMMFLSIYDCGLSLDYVTAETVHLLFLRLVPELAAEYLLELRRQDKIAYLKAVEELVSADDFSPIWPHIETRVVGQLQDQFGKFIQEAQKRNALFLQDILANYLYIPTFSNWMKDMKLGAQIYEFYITVVLQHATLYIQSLQEIDQIAGLEELEEVIKELRRSENLSLILPKIAGAVIVDVNAQLPSLLKSFIPEDVLQKILAAGPNLAGNVKKIFPEGPDVTAILQNVLDVGPDTASVKKWLEGLPATGKRRRKTGKEGGPTSPTGAASGVMSQNKRNRSVAKSPASPSMLFALPAEQDASDRGVVKHSSPHEETMREMEHTALMPDAEAEDEMVVAAP